MINKEIKLIMCFLFTILLAEFPYYEVITNTNPYPSKLFIHTLSATTEYNDHSVMSIFNESLIPYWWANSKYNGLCFSKQNDKISYFHRNMSNETFFWIVANNQMEEIDTLSYDFGLNGFMDFHEFQITDNNHYIFMGYYSDTLDLSSMGGNSQSQVNKIVKIIEMDENHNTILDWDAMDHLNIYDYNDVNISSSGNFAWLHINSIEIDFDDNLIISNRRSSEILKIDRQTGDLIWVFSGLRNEFDIIGDSYHGVSKQHDARRLDNGNLLIFDNGNDHIPQQTRVVEYSIDETNKTATLVWEFLEPNNFESIATGSSQRLPNGNTLIYWGTLKDSQGNTQPGGRIMEVDIDKHLVLDIHFPYNRPYRVRKDEWEFNIPMGLGDSNLDDIVNILDIVYLVNYILSTHEETHSIFNSYKTDLNIDQKIDVIDIISLVNIVIG